jgi:hypothetical protein
MIERERLGHALTAEPAPPPAPLRSWLEAARIEGIDALLASRWQSLPDVAQSDRAACQDVLRRAGARELLFQSQEQRVLAALVAEGIDALVLKGAALSRWLYPEPRLRPRSDLDLLLRSETEFERCRTVLATLGYADLDAPVLPPSYERALRKQIGGGEHCVDAHWRLSNHPAFARCFSFDTLWTRRRLLPGLANGFGLGPVHAMIHACLHRACNLTDAAGDKLIWLYDIALLASRMDADEWSDLIVEATAARVAEPCRHSFIAARRYFDATIPESALQSLSLAATRETFRMERAHNLGYRSWWAFRTLPWSERPRWLWRRLFPEWRYMQAHFGLLRRSQLPKAWILRLMRLLQAIWR